MTADRDTTRIVRSWLEEGVTALPDRVLDAVLDQLPATPQRRAPWPARRSPSMLISFRLAAAAVLAAVFAGITIPFYGLVQESGAPPSLSPTPLPYTWPGNLEAGTYSSRMIWDAPVTFTFTVPEGWQGLDVEVINEPKGLGLMFSLVDDVYADPCGHVLHDPPIGPSVAELTTALAGLPGTNAEGVQPTPTTFAGYHGEALSFTVPDDVGCPHRSFFMWDAPPDSLRAGFHTAGYVPFYSERAHHHIWVIDVDGLRYLVDASSAPDATSADLAELQAVVDSVRIDLTDDASSIGRCSLEVSDPASGGAVEEPYVVTMGDTSYDVRGMYPVDENGEPLLPEPPLAQIDFTGEGWGGRPGVGLKGPTPDDQGFATVTPVNGFQGSFVFDAPGTWIATIDGHDGCYRKLPVEVMGPAG